MLNIPPVFTEIPLSEYDQAMPDLVARVWVNPTLELVREREAIGQETFRIMQELKGAEMLSALESLTPRRYAYLIRILSHGELDDRRWVPDMDELNGLNAQSPDFMIWLTRRIAQELDDWRTREKKVSAPR